MIVFACPRCGRQIEVEDARTGAEHWCPECGTAIAVPAAPRDRQPPSAVSETVSLAAGVPQAAGPPTVVSPADEKKDGNRPPPELTDFLAPAQASDEMGRLGPYRVLAVLGRGGMGVVFRAHDPQLDRPVALKAMLPSQAGNPIARERFFREARATAALKHPHVVTVFDVGEDRGAPFLAMELLEGEPLDARLQREGRLPVAEVLRIGRQAAEALAAAHARGLIHRDVKPANLWLEEHGDKRPACPPGEERAGGPLAAAGGHVKVLDFGLARALGQSGPLTRLGAVVGTPAYMAPEQAGDGEVDHRCDLFSLGCVLYQMGTGRRPFAGKDVLSTLRAVARTQPPPPRELNPDIPEGLNELILSLLSKDPAGRPASAAAVVEALRRLEGPSSDRPAPAAVGLPQRRAAKGQRIRLSVGLVLAGLLAAGVALVLRGRHDGPMPAVGTGATAPSPRAGTGAGAREGVIEPEPFHWEPGAPLSSAVLVQRPPPIRGLASWTLLPGASRPGPARVAYRPDGRRFAAVDYGGFVRIWDAEDGRLLRVLIGPPADTRGIRWSPDGRYLATAHGRAVVVWEEATGRLLRTLGHAVAAATLDWSPDGLALACGLDDGTLCLWDPGRGEERGRFHGHTDGVLDVRWSPDGKTLASASMDRCARLWSVETGKCLQVLLSPGSRMSALAWSPTGEEIATAGGDQAPRILDAARGEVQWAAGGRFQDEAIVWLPDGTLATAGFNGSIHLWKRTQREPLRRLPVGNGWLTTLACSPDGKKLLCGCQDGAIQEWDAASGVRRRPIAPGDPPSWVRPSWSPDGSKIAFHGEIHGVDVWQTDGARPLLALPTGPNVEAVAWSTDGRRLAAAAEDKEVSIWDTTSGQLLRKLPGHAKRVSFVAWSPDGKVLASGSSDQTVRLWAGDSGEPLRTLHGHTNDITGLAWCPDSKRLASCSSDGTVRLWQADADKALRVHDARAGHLWTVAWSPDGAVVAAGGVDRTIRWWDARSGEQIKELTGHAHAVRWLSWSAEGLLASAGQKGGVRVWEGATGRFLFSPEHDGEAWEGVAWSPDGKALAGVGGNTRYFWDAQGRQQAILWISGKPVLAVSREGHVAASPGAEAPWVYVALTEAGEYQTLAPEEFAARYGWKNDPSKVQIPGRRKPPLQPR